MNRAGVSSGLRSFRVKPFARATQGTFTEGGGCPPLRYMRGMYPPWKRGSIFRRKSRRNAQARPGGFPLVSRSRRRAAGRCPSPGTRRDRSRARGRSCGRLDVGLRPPAVEERLRRGGAAEADEPAVAWHGADPPGRPRPTPRGTPAGSVAVPCATPLEQPDPRADRGEDAARAGWVDLGDSDRLERRDRTSHQHTPL